MHLEEKIENYFTTDQESQFERDGFFIIEDVLSSTACKNVLSVVDSIWENYNKDEDKNFLHMFDFFNSDTFFLQMIDEKKILYPILKLLGWNIYIYHAHLDVNPPIEKELKSPPLAWHRDNARMNLDYGNGSYPRVAIKASYWLSDVSEVGRGNLYIVPGSHKLNYHNFAELDKEDFPQDAIPIIVKQGAVVLFDSRIWHSRSNNRSNRTRKVIFLGFAYRWLRPRDDVQVSDKLLSLANPIQKQLLERIMCKDSYDPKETSVPIKKLYDRLLGKE